MTIFQAARVAQIGARRAVDRKAAGSIPAGTYIEICSDFFFQLKTSLRILDMYSIGGNVKNAKTVNEK